MSDAQDINPIGETTQEQSEHSTHDRMNSYDDYDIESLRTEGSRMRAAGWGQTYDNTLNEIFQASSQRMQVFLSEASDKNPFDDSGNDLKDESAFADFDRFLQDLAGRAHLITQEETTPEDDDDDDEATTAIAQLGITDEPAPKDWANASRESEAIFDDMFEGRMITLASDVLLHIEKFIPEHLAELQRPFNTLVIEAETLSHKSHQEREHTTVRGPTKRLPEFVEESMLALLDTRSFQEFSGVFKAVKNLLDQIQHKTITAKKAIELIPTMV